jgi:hypothetical protein
MVYLLCFGAAARQGPSWNGRKVILPPIEIAFRPLRAAWNRLCLNNRLNIVILMPSFGRVKGLVGCSSKGSRKNKLLILGVETPGRQDVESQEYFDITRFYTGIRKGCISPKMVSYF